MRHFINGSTVLLFAHVVIGAIAAPPSAGAQTGCSRYWYDNDFRNRIEATLVAIVQEDTLELCTTDGKVVERELDSLSDGDIDYVRSILMAKDAIELLNASAYADARKDVDEIGELLSDYRVPDNLFRPLIDDFRETTKRRLSEIRDSWIEVNGVRYLLADVRPSEVQSGISSMRVFVTRTQIVSIPFGEAALIRLLPAYRGELDETRVIDRPFQRRGVPVRSTLAEEFRWKYELVFDPNLPGWTDPKSARAHQLTREFSTKLESSRFAERYAASRWHFHRGTARAEVDEHSEAILEFDRAASADPSFADPRLFKALSLDRLGKASQAIEEVTSAISIYRRGMRNTLIEHEQLVRCYSLRSRLKASLADFESAIEDSKLAVTFSGKSRLDESNELLTSIERRAAAHFVAEATELHLRPEVDRAEEERLLRAHKLALRALELDPDSPTPQYVDLERSIASALSLAWEIQATRLAESGNFSKAIGLLRKAIDLTDRGELHDKLTTFQDRYHEQLVAEARQILAEAAAARSRKRWDEAIEACDRGLIIDAAEVEGQMRTEAALCHFGRGLARFNTGKAGAEQDFKRAIELDPTGTEQAHYQLGRLALSKQRFDESIESFTRFLTRDRKDESPTVVADAHFLRGCAYAAIDRSTEAEQDLIAACRLRPTEGRTWSLLAAIQYGMGKITEAERSIDLTLRLSPNDETALLTRAKIRFDSSELDRALDDVRTVLGRRIDSPEAKNLETSILRELQLRHDAKRRADHLDPYYFDEDQLDAAIADLAGAGITALFGFAMDSEAKDSESLTDFLAYTFAAEFSRMGSDRFVDQFLRRVYPNLPTKDRLAMSAILKSLFRGELRYLGLAIAEEKLVELIRSEHPEVSAFAPSAARILLKVNQRISQIRR